MKTRFYSVFAALLAWFSVSAVAQNVCIETGAQRHGWYCCGDGSVDDLGSIDPSEITVCPGDPITPPDVTPPTFNPGQKCQDVTFNCPENPPYTETEPVNYSPGEVYWEPEIPGSLDDCGTYEYNAYVDAFPDIESCEILHHILIGTFTVHVGDEALPEIECPGSFGVPTDEGECSAVVDYDLPEATDTCPVTVECDPPPGSTFDKGDTEVVCIATDCCSDTASCSFTITVYDLEDPKVTCPSPMTKPTDAGQCSAVVSYTTPTATDNCPDVGPVTCSPPSGSTFPKGITTVTCTVTDSSDNTGDCNFTVTVKDEEKPTITCPGSISKGTDAGQCSASASFTATPNDNCPGVTYTCSPASGSSFPKGTTTVTCTATDTSGNASTPCTFTVTVVDDKNPNVTCPGNITVNTAKSSCSGRASFAATATDNCPGVSYTCSPASGSTFPKGTTSVTCTATDASGNTASCSFSVTVVDNVNPTISCPPNQDACGSASGAVVTYPAPTYADNCPGVTYSCTPASGATFPPGLTTVNCTATDASGNTAACSFTVNVVVLGNSVEARRTSAPSESFFPVKYGEHFEVGGTYEFKMVGGSTTPSPKLRFEVWDLDGIDDLITSGAGIQFSYTWATGVDEGDAFVRFYCDANGDGTRNWFFEDYIDSEEFWVQQKKVYNLAVEYSDLLPALTLAQVQAELTSNAEHVLRKDTATDWRSCIQITVTSLAQFVSGVSRPDPALNTSDFTLHFNQPHNMTLLSDLWDGVFHLAGRAQGIGCDPTKVLINWPSKTAVTPVHEIGHCRGLLHDGHNTQQIMCEGGTRNPGANELAEDDVDNYDDL